MNNAQKWLEESYFHNNNLSDPKLKMDDIKDLLYYALIWNVFEERIYQKTKRPKKIADNTKLDKFADVLKEAKDYFLQRYRDLEKVQGLNLPTSGYDTSEFSQLLNSSEDKNIIAALIMICVRLRNNLFHGEKKPDVFIEQNILFKHANNVLIYVIDNHKS